MRKPRRSAAVPAAATFEDQGWSRSFERILIFRSLLRPGQPRSVAILPWLIFLLMGSSGLQAQQHAASPANLFEAGNLAYKTGEYGAAVAAYRDSAKVAPASGTFQNLGLAEWQRGQVGPAILAWEQSLWLDAFNPAARGNLRFARKTAQVEAPELAWYEVVSTWLPMSSWAWIGALSFWTAIAATLLPGIFGWRKNTWQQAIAAAALTLFLLSVPALFGLQSRSRLGFVLQKDCPLRLTATTEGQVITKLSSGDPVRLQRARGNFCLVRTSHTIGWLNRADLGLISQNL